MSQTERFADTGASKISTEYDESTVSKIAREAYVFSVGTFGGAVREAVDSVIEHPKETTVKLVESVALGGVLAASQLGPMPIKLAGRVAAAGLGISFFSDAFSSRRWDRLAEVASDTWNSGANTDRNVNVVQGSLGHLVFDSALMIGGAKLGSGLVRKGIDLRYGTAVGKIAPDMKPTELGAGRSILAESGRESVKAGATPDVSAKVVLSQMRGAGFTSEQMRDPGAVSIAKSILLQDPHLLPTAAETARILPAQELSVASTKTVQAMIDAGWNPRSIHRSDVFTAEAILREGGYPTSLEVRKLRLDERFLPRPDARIPPAIVPQRLGFHN